MPDEKNINQILFEAESQKEDFAFSPFNDIILSKFQGRRQEQLKNINDARMNYGNAPYGEEFERLDLLIEDIEDDIYTCMKAKDIAKKHNVKPYIFALWCRGSIHLTRLQLAYLLSADYQMDLSTKVLEDSIMDRDLNGNFKKTEIEYAGLIRELSLAHSRQAGFKNQGKFGKKPSDGIIDKPVQHVTPEQMDLLIQTLREDKRKELNHQQDYMSYEEVRPQFINNDGHIVYEKPEPMVVQPEKSLEQEMADMLANKKASEEEKDFNLDEITENA